MMKTISVAFLTWLIFGIMLVPASFSLTEPYYHSLWKEFLEKYVSEEGEIDYDGIKKDPGLLEQYLDQLKRTSAQDTIFSWPREEQLALWLNVYHATLLHEILNHYPLKGVQDIPGLWDRRIVQIGDGEDVIHRSLNEVRSVELMGRFRDEKIHACLWFGTKGGPKLRREPYLGPTVEGQLFVATREFINDLERNQIASGEKKIQISEVFKWYANDFVMDFGSVEQKSKLPSHTYAVLSFIAYYLADVEKVQYLESGKYKVKYLSMDWDLNQWQKGQQENLESPAFS